MQEASFSGVIRAIFYFIIFYYVFKFVVRLLLPIILRKAVSKAEENLRKQHYGRPREEEPVINRNKPNVRSGKDKNAGEYVDFEEIE